MFSEPRADLPCQIETGEIRIALFKKFDPSEALHVVVESAPVFHQFVQFPFSAVTEGAVSDIMGQGNGFHEIFIGADGPRDGAAYGGHLHGMGQPGTIVIGRGFVDVDLGLVFETAKGPAMQNPVAIPLKFRSIFVPMLGMLSSAGGRTAGGAGGQPLVFQFLSFFPRMDHGSIIVFGRLENGVRVTTKYECRERSIP